MADPTDLFKAMNTSALIDAAKYGGYGGIDLNSLTASRGGKLGGLADVLLPALHAALPNSPLFSMANAARQAFNVNQYNKQSQAQALYALQQDRLGQTSDADIAEKRTGYRPQGNFNRTFFDQSAGDIRDDNAKPSLNAVIDGKALKLDPHANYDPSFIRDYIGRMGDVSNFQNQSKGLGAIADGQNQSLIHNALIHNSGGPIGGLQQGTMDNSQPGMLSTGISRSSTPQYIQDGVSPYLMPTDIPAQIAGNQRAGLSDAQAYGQQTETNRHNTTTETETKRQFDQEFPLKVKDTETRRISALKPSGGGSQNPYTIPNAAQNYTQGQINAIDKELGTLGYVGANGTLKPITPNSPPGLFGLGGHQQTPQEQRAQQLMDLRDQLQSQILPSSPAPFKNSSPAKIKNAGKNVGAQYGVQY